MKRFLVLFLLFFVSSGLAPVRSQNPNAQNPCQTDRNVWVSHAIEEMRSIRIGMTRKQLLGILTTEGGVSTRLTRTYVSRECPYFKIDVEFKASGEMEKDREGHLIQAESGDDIIATLSKPYLDFSISD